MKNHEKEHKKVLDKIEGEYQILKRENEMTGEESNQDLNFTDTRDDGLQDLDQFSTALEQEMYPNDNNY